MSIVVEDTRLFTQYLNIYHSMIKKFEKQTKFTRTQLSYVLFLYYKFALVNGEKAKYVTKDQMYILFETLFGLHEKKFVDRILLVLAPDLKRAIKQEAWVKLFEVYTVSTLEEQIEFCFKVYDVNGTGYLTRDVIQRAAEDLISIEDEDLEELQLDLTDVLINKMDVDKDGRISFDDYKETVMKNPKLLEFLGRIMPDSNIIFEVLPL